MVMTTSYTATIDGVIEVLLDIFGNARNLLAREPQDLMWIYRRTQRVRQKLPANLYRPNAFNKLILAARLIAEQRSADKER
jgi:hypothetical protein